MAEVKAVPQWVMLEAIRNKVQGMLIEKSDEAYGEGYVAATPTDFEIDTAATDPVLKLKVSNPKTIQVGLGTTVTAIVLNIVDVDAPTAYLDGGDEIRYPIVDVDGNGEYFPDGGSIDTTEFEVYLNDL